MNSLAIQFGSVVASMSGLGRRPPDSGHLGPQTPPSWSGAHQNAPDMLNTLPKTSECLSPMYAAASPPALRPPTMVRADSCVTL